MLFSPLPGTPQHLGGIDYRLTQGFGSNPNVYDDFGLMGHNGWDIAPLKAGTKGLILYAPMDGFVTVKNDGKKGYGLHIILTALPHPVTGHKTEVTLGHIERTIDGLDGKFLRTVDPLGIMGNTGFSSNVHCHITVRYKLSDGSYQQYNNGFKGAQNISQFFRIWQNTSPFLITPQ